MTSKIIAQSDRQQKSEKPQGSGILQRSAVRSVSDVGMQSTDDKEAQPLSNLAFSKDFSRVPISTTKPQQFHARNPQSHPMPPIQGKLTIGEPNDRYEQEADRVASEVVQRINAPSSAVQRVPQPQHQQYPTTEPLSASVAARIIQAKGEMIRNKQVLSEVQRPNKTGLPDRLKIGIEKLSGYSMDDVRVHYNSDKPTQLQAYAYAQGMDIHVASGQEKHLSHEAWHVVQQMQGRVKPTMQMKGVQINDDQRLEREADEMEQRASQFTHDHMEAIAVRTREKVNNHPLVYQRRIKLDVDGVENNVIRHIERNFLTYSFDINEIFQEVVKEKPPEIKNAINKQFPKGILSNELFILINKWNTDVDKEYPYTDNKEGFRKLTKDAIKFYLHKEYDWRSIGVAEYMTGDATGLAMAPVGDPKVSIKVLMGKQNKQKTDYGPTFFDTKDGNKKLPTIFDKADPGNHHIIKSDVEKKEKYEGTSDLYAKRYKNKKNKKEAIVKPWNKETWEGTKIIGEAYNDKEKREKIQSIMQLDDSSEDTNKKLKIQKYKSQILDEKLHQMSCIILWGRESGKHGGAHKELDSHKLMVIQLVKLIRDKFKDRMLIFVGDEVVKEDELKDSSKKVVFLGKFWNSPEASEYAPELKDRDGQRYLFQLLAKENKAISIGMRSGSLEGMAMVGLPVIFIDDKGNQAEERMELWAGKAANKRRDVWEEQKKMTNDQMEHPKDIYKEMDTWEKKNQGPMPNYKRVATRLKMGSEIDKREKKHQTINDVYKFFNNCIGKKDKNEDPICNINGNGVGNNILKEFMTDEWKKFVKEPKSNILDDKILKDFFNNYGKLLNQIKNREPSLENGKIKFKEPEVKDLITGSKFLLENNLLHDDELQQIEFLVKHLSGEESKEENLKET